ncbi:glutamate receptor ionotropic, NMDA 3A [Patella vulgata]|uniref:glutamate receptor ionotropic, NMDA 3A n=1 Tax=Patella vulgata TaxID=6465 RepID=UPI0024A8C51C|nr:glutamate receptor ionotropic, NMDA 3A [Patella vulgata]
MSRQPVDQEENLVWKSVNVEITDIEVEYLLTELSITGWKILVLHMDPHWMIRIVRKSLDMNLFRAGYAWFLSDKTFIDEPSVVQNLPEGLLALTNFHLTGSKGVLSNVFRFLSQACLCVDFLKSSGISPNLFEPTSSSVDTSDTFIFSKPELFRYLSRASQCFNDTEPNENSTLLATGEAFHLVNLVDKKIGGKQWELVGYITVDGLTDLKTVLWPGNTIFGPSSNKERTYRVVTKPAKPFVFINGPVAHPSTCYSDTPCIKLTNSTPRHVSSMIEDFITTRDYMNKGYDVHCCTGLTIELLLRLSLDMKFEYVIYFLDDTDYGSFANDTWTGMVGDIVNGAADIIAGAFSVTSSRLTAISYSEPYFQSDYAMVTSVDGRSTSMWAFLKPFSFEVWICILLSSIAAGIATSILEWHSPFGLNPRGRKRDKNYGLGSGLLMVWVLITGHTINVKAPKSWPGKVIQNVWAGLAIFIMTSYTANLAAYLAGQSAVILISSIYDAKLLSKKVALIESSSVEFLLNIINPDLIKNVRHNYISSTDEAIFMLRDREIDVYVDDTPLLQYSVARLDKDCAVRFVGKGFGSDGYAFGLPKFSWLQVPLSNKVLEYAESGFVNDLSSKYLSRPKCEHYLATSPFQYSLEHTGGLFIILLSAVVTSILLLLGEHMIYKYVVPWLRNKPQDSKWIGEHLYFFSQRLSRVVKSETLYSQKHAAQEMMTIVRTGDFTRLIQKHELQKRKMPPPKKEKTRAQMFQELTSNIVSYHRQLKTDTSEEHSEEEVEETRVDPEEISAEVHVEDEDESSGVANLGYREDEADTSDGDEISIDLVESQANSPQRRPYQRLCKRYSTWPSGLVVYADTGKVSPFKKQVSMSAGTSPTTEPESPSKIWVISDGRVLDDRVHSPRVSPARKLSDIGVPRSSHTRDEPNNAKRSKSYDHQQPDYFKRNLKMKDNRVKSTIRRHALSGYQSQIPVDYLDECTIDALSKEDLLILWKKSEIEMQRRLNEVKVRNRRLSLAIDYLVKHQGDSEGAEEV